MATFAAANTRIESAPTTPNPSKTSSADAVESHLRHLIERQPSCLLRVARTGNLLACNDAGLNLLGKTELAQVLDKPFEAHLAAEHAAAWREFTDRVWTDGAGSIESNLASEGGANRTVLLQAIALRDHPDGVESLLLAVRDTSPLRRLEESLRGERAVQQKLAETEARLKHALLQKEQLTALLEEGRAEHQRLTTQLQTHAVTRDAAADTERQVEAARAEAQELSEKLTATEIELAASRAERQHLASQLEAIRSQQQVLVKTLEEREAQQQALVKSLEERDAQKQLLVKTLEERDAQQQRAIEERGRLEAALKEREAERDREAADRQRLEASLRDHSAVADSLTETRQKLDTALAEQQRLAALVAGAEIERQRLATLVDAGKAEHDRLVAAVRDREAEHARAAEERRALEASLHTRSGIESALADAQAQLDVAVREQQHVNALLDESRTREQQLAVTLADRDAERARVASERGHLEASLRERDAERERAVEELRRLETVLRDRDADVQRWADDRRRLETALQERDAELQRLAEERQRLEASVDGQRDASRQLSEAIARVDAAVAEQQRLTGELEASRAEQQRLAIAVAQRDVERESVAAERRADQILWQEQIDRQQLTAAERDRESRDRIAALEAQLQAALAETREAARLLDEQRATGDEVARAADERRQTIASLEADLARALAEEGRLASRVEKLERLQHSADAEHAAERDRLKAERDAVETRAAAALARQQQEAAGQRDRDRETLADLEGRHAKALAEQQLMTLRIEELTTELRRVAAEHEAALARKDRELADATTQDAELRRLVETEASLRAEITRLTNQYEEAESVRERERSEVVANLQAELAVAVKDRKRLQTLLSRIEASHQRMAGAHAALTVERDHALKLVADQLVEIAQWGETACALEPLAAAGRLAIQVSRELLELVSKLDERAHMLLNVSLLDARYRPDVELLRADVMRTASLARQLTKWSTEPAPPRPAGRPLPRLPETAAKPSTGAEAL